MKFLTWKRPNGDELKRKVGICDYCDREVEVWEWGGNQSCDDCHEAYLREVRRLSRVVNRHEKSNIRSVYTIIPYPARAYGLVKLVKQKALQIEDVFVIVMRNKPLEEINNGTPAQRFIDLLDMADVDYLETTINNGCQIRIYLTNEPGVTNDRDREKAPF